jgi:ligand-binding sensor domain-containing protein/signal transduction histidine kinase
MRGRHLATLLVCMLLVPGPGTRAERLPITTYTTADGLCSDRIQRVVRDSNGYLWICQLRGLSRFDGQRFKSYGPEHGLPEGPVNGFLETRSGLFLVATSDGLYRFDPLAEGRWFVRLETGESPEPRFADMVEDHEGRIWARTSAGPLRIEIVRDRARCHPFDDVEIPPPPDGTWATNALLVSSRGDLWIGTRAGLIRRASDGGSSLYTTSDGLPGYDVRALLEDREERIWVGTTRGLARLIAEPWNDTNIVSEVLLDDLPGPSRTVLALFESVDGTLWIGNPAGLGELALDGSGNRRLRRHGTADGLSQEHVVSFADDLEGNLWIATEAGGVMRLALGGLVSYAEAEGIDYPRIGSIFETRSGELCAAAGGGALYCHRDGRFRKIRPNVSAESLGWGWHQWSFQDRAGDWWIPTGEGLYRFTGLRRPEDLGRATPTAIYTMRDGLGADYIFRLFEDSRGDVWIGTLTGTVHEQLTRWDRRSETFQRFGPADGLPKEAVTAFREDGRGGLWIGFYAGGVARYREGRFERFTPEDGCPKGFVRALHLDREGRLWVATSRGGVARVDDPAAPVPAFETYTTADGLSANLVSTITEDDRGRLYFGTDRGIDRFDPGSGQIRHFSTADGLPNTFVNVSRRDRNGVLWFGTLRGIARLAPTADRPSPPPPVFIDRVRIAGSPHPVSELGATEVVRARLPHRRNRALIEFGGICFRLGGDLRYQYLLEGVDDDWSEPATNRSVDYANLAPGAYRFQVRAVASDGQISPAPATFAFTVLRPIWQRWWFLLSMTFAVAAIALALHRLRVARAVTLERVRTRIATDLHDDIGSSLSQIVILSEMLQRRVDRTDTVLTPRLMRIAAVSRELVDSMSDIVWAINPKRDRLSDVVFRMRRFAADAFTGKQIDFTFQAPRGESDLSLGPDVRREVYLVFKESVNNVVRHSECSHVEIELRVGGDGLHLQVRDDGRGFDTGRRDGGHGLESMRRRARRLGGTLELLSLPGKGTTVRLVIPLGRSRRFGRRRSLPE